MPTIALTARTDNSPAIALVVSASNFPAVALAAHANKAGDLPAIAHAMCANKDSPSVVVDAHASNLPVGSHRSQMVELAIHLLITLLEGL